jgi:ATP-dependent DNA helicase RecQ
LVQTEIDSTDRWLLENPLPIPAARMVGLSEGISLLDSKQRSPLFVRFMKTRQEMEEVDSELMEILTPHLKKGFFNAIVPLPSTTWKGRDATAKAIGEFLQVPVYTDLLIWKEAHAQRQGTLLNNDQRKLNVHKKMEVAHTPPDGPILLLDDYTGSGATLREAARAMRTAGGKELILIPLTIATVKWRLGHIGFI